MASCCRRYRARRLKALGHDPQFLVNRPAPPATSLDHLKPFKLSTALMAVHKDCYAPIGLIQQGGPRRRETIKKRLMDLAARYEDDYKPPATVTPIHLEFASRGTGSERQRPVASERGWQS